MELYDDEGAIRQEDRMPGWPGLISQLVMDFTKVLEAEGRLIRASIEPSLTAVLERWLLHLVIASLAMAGCMLLIGAAVILLHTWMAWWLCFAIAGAATIVLALCALLIR